jgi:ABC-type sugar transport system ATPase subunit
MTRSTDTAILKYRPFNAPGARRRHGEGVIQQADSPQRLYDEPANLFVAGFIGSPPMNFVPARLVDARIELPFGDVDLPTENPGTACGVPRARLPRSSPGSARST